MKSDREEKRQKSVTALAPSVGYRGHAPIATSTEKRQRLISAPDGVEERNTLRT
ncbi:MAG: hypothetical protein HXN55_11305 [Prevotella nigrescens]|uniref:Uncharacterized protein n=1 Tax=Prevotella nigrescens TaxID=28133 RepID=A0A9D5X243_9BACT|nr:hypothetical protein [Prevotella nigrescens]MBF1447942.1 hypothetical protein [Prevotella nigrescens]